MKFRVQVVCVQDDGSERCCDVMELERQQLVRETLGLSVAEGKAILHGVQEFVTAQQAAKISSAGANARTAASDTRAKKPECTP